MKQETGISEDKLRYKCREELKYSKKMKKI